MIINDVIQSLENVDEVGLDYKVMGHTVRNLLGYMSRRLNAQSYHLEVITKERDEAISHLDGARETMSLQRQEIDALKHYNSVEQDRVDCLKVALKEAEETVEDIADERDTLSKMLDKANEAVDSMGRRLNKAVGAKKAAETNEADMTEENRTMVRDLTHLREENGKLRMTLQERTKRIEAMQVRVRDGQDAQTFVEGFYQNYPHDVKFCV